MPGSANFEFFERKNNKKSQQTLNFAVFFTNEECPKLLCGLGIDHRRRKTIPVCGIVWVKKEFFRASLYVCMYLQY